MSVEQNNNSNQTDRIWKAVAGVVGFGMVLGFGVFAVAGGAGAPGVADARADTAEHAVIDGAEAASPPADADADAEEESASASASEPVALYDDEGGAHGTGAELSATRADDTPDGSMSLFGLR